jgi:hypothetical protein
MAQSSDPIPFRPKRSDAVRSAHTTLTDPAAESAPKEKPRGLPASPGTPTDVQRSWLVRGLSQPGGKLPLFDEGGKRIDARTIRSCIDQGWAEPWFANPLKPDWLVCRLTELGRNLLSTG